MLSVSSLGRYVPRMSKRSRAELVHHFEGSINRGSVGTDTQRFFELSGSKLILRPPLIKTPEGDVIMTNVWERLTD